jgi:hypothetical protein
MKVLEIAARVEALRDLSPIQLRVLAKALEDAAQKSTDTMTQGFTITLGDLVSDIDHELWEESEEATMLSTFSEQKADFEELAGA